jgi:pyruvate-formate lyase-activating enzyme
MNSGVPYEFRTTFPPSLSAEDIGLIAAQIKGAEKYCIQQYRKTDKEDPEPHTPSEVRRAAQLAEEIPGIKVEIRGI